MTWNTRIIFTAVFLFISVFSKAQISGTVSYKLTVVDAVLNSTSTINSVLYIKDNKSLQVNLSKDIKPQDLDENIRIDVFKGRTKFVLKDFKSKTLLLSDNIVVKTYLIDDSLANFKWKITKEKKQILGFKCIKALLEFRGRSYISWFANDIPI
jgi:GLPGLI family protein